jgi:hypothetical protein
VLRKFNGLILLVAICCPFTALAQPATNLKIESLANILSAAMTTAEQHATAAAFPRKNTLAAVSRSMWETFYRGDYSSADEAAAIDLVTSTANTPIMQEAAKRMKYELQLN